MSSEDASYDSDLPRAVKSQSRHKVKPVQTFTGLDEEDEYSSSSKDKYSDKIEDGAGLPESVRRLMGLYDTDDEESLPELPEYWNSPPVYLSKMASPYRDVESLPLSPTRSPHPSKGKILPLSMLVGTTREQRKELMPAVETQIRSSRYTNNCNKPLASGITGEAWKVCEMCDSDGCDTCCNCLVAKFPIEGATISTDEVIAHEYIQKVGSSIPYGAPERHIYKLVDVEPAISGGVIPFTELIEGPIVNGTQFNTVYDLIKNWLANPILISDNTWRSINLQVFGTIAALRTVIPNFHHNDCHLNNVMLTTWEGSEDQMYRSTSHTFRLSPQLFQVKIIDFGQVTSEVPTCNTIQGNKVWSEWINTGLIDFCRFVLSLTNKILSYRSTRTKYSPALDAWLDFVVRQIGDPSRKNARIPVEGLTGITFPIRKLGINEQVIISKSGKTVADVMDDEYFAEFRI